MTWNIGESGSVAYFDGVTKLYQRGRGLPPVVAIGDLSLRVQQGARLALVGPNGAGKTTAIQLLLGLAAPTDGRVALLGDTRRPRSPTTLRHVSVVFGGRPTLPQDLSVERALKLHTLAYNVAGVHSGVVGEAVARLVPPGLMAARVGSLSLGERTRVELAAAIAVEPQLLVLDEPTIGLDILARRAFRADIVALLGELDLTLVLTSHDVSDIERLCQDVLVLSQGRALFQGSTSQLLARYAAPARLVLTVEEPIRDINDIGPDYHVRSTSPHHVVVTSTRPSVPIWGAVGIISRATTVLEARLVEDTMEDAIAALYQSADSRTRDAAGG